MTNAPRYEFQRYLADRERLHAARAGRRLKWAIAITAGAILVSCVAARADGDLPPTALRAEGVCEGLRAAGGINSHRPVAVTVQLYGGTMLFRCDPVAAGQWKTPVARTVRWDG